MFKIAIFGDGGVGKSTYLNRLITGQFSEKYIATFDMETKHLQINSNNGVISFEIYDIAGQEKFTNPMRKYNVDGAILMFDLTSQRTLSSIPKFRTHVENVKIVLVGNKSDIKEQSVSNEEKRNAMTELDCPYYDISAKSNYNYEKPFLSLAQQLTGFKDLIFI